MAEIESVIEPSGITNDIRWKSVTTVSIHPEIILYRELTCQYLLLGSVAKPARFNYYGDRNSSLEVTMASNE